METIICKVLPRKPRTDVVYRLVPKNFSRNFYLQRTDRNIGWITEEEQGLLHGSVVGIAGCGGMGGLISSTMLRCGIGEIRIADIESFDVSNLNRQFASNMKSLGRSKAFETAALLRSICPDTIIVVYPQGITRETVGHFVRGCDVICDEIELWALGARILLHRAMRKCNGVTLNCSTVGHRVYLTKFTAGSMHIEEVVKMSYSKAARLQERIQQGTATHKEVRRLMDAVLRFAAPELPEYSVTPDRYSTRQAVLDRLSESATASIIATNPPMASGFLSNQVLFHLLQKSSIKRSFVLPPSMPGYAMIDAALMETKRFEGIWWNK